MSTKDVKVKRLTETAILPTQSHPGDAGWDLYSDADIVIQPGETVKIPTGIAIELPENSFGGIYARSGLATKRGLRPANCVGVCDCQYRGEYIVALHNDSDSEQVIAHGDRIAQLIIQPYIPVALIETTMLQSTERGDNGFGSTGM